jgi:hypothetical protein
MAWSSRLRLSQALLAVMALLAGVGTATASTITFSEPEVTSLLTHTYVGSRPMQYSDQMPSFSLGGVTFQAFGAVQGGVPDFYLRTTFDDRSPSAYPYDFIAGNLMQVRSTGLVLTFAGPVLGFGFGAALNATASLGRIDVELFGALGQSLGSSPLALDRTVLSTSGGTNSNSEGRFSAPSGLVITYARLTSFGDGTANASQFNWVIDQVSYLPATIPEPSTWILLGTGLAAVARRSSMPRAQSLDSSALAVKRESLWSRNESLLEALPELWRR